MRFDGLAVGIDDGNIKLVAMERSCLPESERISPGGGGALGVVTMCNSGEAAWLGFRLLPKPFTRRKVIFGA